jgi:hypothetical protein
VKHAIRIRRAETLLMPAGAEDARPHLIYPDCVQGWTIGAWDGARWYDIFSGELLNPQLIAEIPDQAVTKTLVDPIISRSRLSRSAGPTSGRPSKAT